MDFNKFKIEIIKKPYPLNGFEVYICANTPFRLEPPHPLAGKTVFTVDCISEEECRHQIDLLIRDLEQLKAKTSQLFAERPNKN